MTRYVASRLAMAAVTVLVIVVVSFLLTRIVPGDPVQAIVGEFPVPEEYVEQVREDYGLDRPLPLQLWLYITNLFSLDLGFSFANRQEVLPLVLEHAGRTLILIVPALVIASILGVAAATAAARKPGSFADSWLTVFVLFGYSVPVFWLGQVMIMFFAIRLEWLPAQGMFTAGTDGSFSDLLRHWALPGLNLTLYFMAVVARVGRASVVEALQQDLILTARAKGISQRRVLTRHALPNAMIPIVTVIGYNFSHALTGAILTEVVFGWPGIGVLFIDSIGNRDYPVLQGIFVLTAVGVVLANLATDLAYFGVDPRIRAGRVGRA